jgi:hypothetical protein
MGETVGNANSEIIYGGIGRGISRPESRGILFPISYALAPAAIPNTEVGLSGLLLQMLAGTGCPQINTRT